MAIRGISKTNFTRNANTFSTRLTTLPLYRSKNLSVAVKLRMKVKQAFQRLVSYSRLSLLVIYFTGVLRNHDMAETLAQICIQGLWIRMLLDG
jgi:hypothetical protein